jgi:hypothetical protein
MLRVLVIILVLFSYSTSIADEKISIEKTVLNKEELTVLNNMNKVYTQYHIEKIYINDSVFRYYKSDSDGKNKMLYLTEVISRFKENNTDFTYTLKILPEVRNGVWSFRYDRKSDVILYANGTIEYHSPADFTRTESKCNDTTCETTIWKNEKVIYNRSEKTGAQ